MKFTLGWLKEHLDTDADLNTLSEVMTNIGLEVESIDDPSEIFEPFIVAEIKDAKPHPNADRLQVCSVNDGKQDLQIVCGAPNARKGIKVILAPIGVRIPTNDMKIKKSKIRDVESNGMLCSASELGLGGDSDGIQELPEDATVGTPFANALGINDPIFDIAITPNRGDCLGVRGIARDLAAAGLGHLKPLNIPSVNGKGASPISVSIDNKNCAAFIGCHIKGVKNGESPDWLKQKLEAVGQQPISALVDITNYLSITFARPSHVYDADKLKGNITVRASKKGETFTALDDKEYKLDDSMVAITDDSGVIGLGGIIGGASTGCTEATTNVFLEIALFDPINIAYTGRKLGIETDARQRFERHVDPGFAEDAAKFAVNMITDLCSGEPSDLVIAGDIPANQNQINYPLDFTESLLGLSIEKDKIISILKTLGCEVTDNGKTLDVTTPSWRSDLSMKADIAEEVARIAGYDSIPTTPLPITLSKEPTIWGKERRIQEAKRLLSTRGFDEAVTFSFIDEKKSKLFAEIDPALKLANPISEQLNYLRPSVIPSLLECHANNAYRGQTNNAISEVGPIFKGAGFYEQQRSISGIRTGNRVVQSIYGKAEPVDVFDVKADALAAISTFIDPEKCHVRAAEIPYYHPGKCGEIVLGQKAIAQFGEIHPTVLKAYDIEEPVAAFEVFIIALPDPKKKASVAKPKAEFSNFQAVTRDFAFIVDEATPAAELVKAAKMVDKILIADVHLFDNYQGKGVEDGKKSLAFSVTIQPKDDTLKDKDIDAITAKIIDSVTKNTGAALRSAS